MQPGYCYGREFRQHVTLSAGRSILLRVPVRHEFRGPALLLSGKEAQFTQVGLFDTHECGRLPSHMLVPQLVLFARHRADWATCSVHA